MENNTLGKQKRVEKNALIVSSIVTFIIAGAGLWVFIVTKIQALFVDSIFSLIIFMSSIFAVVISKVSKRKTKAYPNGHYFLEPLYAILKSLFVLTLLLISVVVVSKTAYKYFAYGIGEEMNIAPVLPYTVCMVVLCFGLGIFNKIQNKRINNVSTILTAEYKSNFVDGIMSAGVGVGILLLYIIDIDGALGFLHYTGDSSLRCCLFSYPLNRP